jgi:predicted nuclease of predicted toxin-antitoxin system
MKLLLDENLPRSLAKALEAQFPGTVHVAHVDLLKAADDVVWNYARENNFSIMSKDRDFADRSDVFGPPPKVVWIRIGNCSVQQLAAAIHASGPEIEEFLSDEHAGLLVIPPGLTT